MNISDTKKVISEPPYTWDAGGEGVTVSGATESTLYCGPANWNVLPHVKQDPYGLATFTPNVSEHVGVPASAITSSKRIGVRFSEDTQGNTPYVFELVAEFNSNAAKPIDIRIWTALFQPPAPRGRLVPGMSANGKQYTVHVDPLSNGTVVTFVPTSNQASGTFDIAPYLRVAKARGWVPSGATLDHIAFALEVYKAWGSQIFFVQGFSVSMN